MNDIPISYPGRYAPGVAINYLGDDGWAQQVSGSAPLPVVLASSVTGSIHTPLPMIGSSSTHYTTVAFIPVPNRPLLLTLTGAWTGTVKLLRGSDPGAPKLPLTLGGAPWAVFTGNVCEPVWEETETSAVFYLDAAVVSGTVTWRLAQ